jgi:alkyl sulfatase BDS1-like metallo-beta-lactamase superfamily hydrolase
LNRNANPGSTPVPDPTVLTTEALKREVDNIKDLMEIRLNAAKALQDEKFRFIELQFTERDVRMDQTSRDAKLAIDAALQAAKEAVGKSEVSTAKQIDELKGRMQSEFKSTDDKINEVKERISRSEGEGFGIWRSSKNNQWSVGVMVSVGIALFSTAVAIALALRR